MTPPQVNIPRQNPSVNTPPPRQGVLDPYQPTELHMPEGWDSAAVKDLVKRHTSRGFMPSMLMLGVREAGLLRQHLAAAFGPEEIGRLSEFHYAGLRVVETRVDSLVKVAGEKLLPELEKAARDLPKWKRESKRTQPWRFDAALA